MSRQFVRTRALIESIQQYDPRLHEALRQIVDEIEAINQEIGELPEGAEPTIPTDTEIPTVLGLSFQFQLDGIFLFWFRPVDEEGNPIYIIQGYEIKVGDENSTFETANSLFVGNTLSFLDQPRIVGKHRYHIKAFDLFGNFSPNAATILVDVPAMGTVDPLTGTVIDNNVNLSWQIPDHTFRIDHYNLFQDDVKSQEVDGTFFSIFSPTAGTFKFGIQGEDVAGNLTTIASLILEVDSPPDFVFIGSFEWQRNGIKVNCEFLITQRLLACINLVDTWSLHFENQGWTTIQQQLDANFPIYIQPTEASASYVEVFDLVPDPPNTPAENVIVNIDLSVEQKASPDDVVLTPQMEASDDGILYGSPVTGLTAFFDSVRFLRVTFQFTSAT